MARRNATKKSVLRTATMRVINLTACVMVAMLSIMFIGCAKEQVNPKPAAVGSLPQDTTTVIINHWQNSSRSLFVNATAKDSLCHSDGIFNMESTMKFTSDEGTLADMKMRPTASVTIDLNPAKQEVKSEAEIKTTVTSTKTITESLTNDGLKFNYHKHIQQKYADGSEANIHLRWSARGYVDANGDTLMISVRFGEVKLDSISYVRNGEKTELYDPFKVTHHFSVPYYEVGVTGQQHQFVLPMAPYREKAITDDPETLITSRLDGKYEGCPNPHFVGTEYVKTNKREFTNPIDIPVVINITAPEEKAQPSLDSLFSETSKGSFKESFFSENTNEDGATIRTKIGTYVSKNTGKESKTNIESTVNFTYSYPTKYTSKWGTYEIDSLKLSFAEGGFTMKSISQDEDSHVWLTMNTVIPTIGSCELNAIDEVVKITVAKEKKAIPVDSTYVWGGSGDNYIMNKTVIMSDGSKTPSQFTYDGHHSVSPVNFGEKVVSNLSWNASGLKANGTSTEDDKKVFTPTTRFEVVYTTTNEVATATNGVESGSFGFNKTSPVVTFIDGQTKLTCPERKLEVNGLGATPASNYTIEVRNGVSYKGFAYNYTSNVVFDGAEEADVTSQGLLLMIADEVGDTTYKDEYVWAGNTLTATVTKTIDHTFANDEVETYTKAVTVSMGDLEDGKVNAENVNFTVTPSNSEKSDDDKDGVWTITKRVRNYTYTVSNGSASRQMTNEVVDYVLVFNDGTHSHTFDGKLNVTNADNFGTAGTEGDFTVTPLTTTVTAVGSGNGAPTLTTKGVTSIYVENKKEISYRFTYEIDPDVSGGSIYADLLAERLVNGVVEKKWSCYGLVGQFGQYKPDVEMIYITDTNFSDNFSTTNHDTDAGQSGLGDEKAFSYVNTSKIENHFSVLFTANADADGNTTREVAGHVNYWSYKYQFTDPDNGHPEYLDFVVTGKTTTHKVDGGVYTRTIEVQINGQTVETQTGKVNVTVE